MSKTIPLSSVDAAWLGMENPTNLMSQMQAARVRRDNDRLLTGVAAT